MKRINWILGIDERNEAIRKREKKPTNNIDVWMNFSINLNDFEK